MWLAACVCTPLVANRSLMPSGMPSSAPPLPLARRSSEAFAIERAISCVTATYALNAALCASIAVRYASVNSVAVISLACSLVRASAMVSCVRSVMKRPLGKPVCCSNAVLEDLRGQLFDHLGHEEEVFFRRRRVGDNDVCDVSIRHPVLSLSHRLRDYGSHGLDAFDIDFTKLFHET